eukprot:m51a1_g2524 hypothetical protein (498) ;mRNA; r:228127-229915
MHTLALTLCLGALALGATVGPIEITSGKLADMGDDLGTYWVYGYRTVYTKPDIRTPGGFKVAYVNQKDSKAHIATVSASNKLTSDRALSFSKTVSEVKGFVVHDDGSFAVALLVPTTKNAANEQLFDVHFAVYDAQGTQKWTVQVDKSQVPDGNDGRLVYGKNKKLTGTPTGYYFVATSRAASGTCSDWALGHWANIEYFIDASTHKVTNVYCWGCSHSWTQGLSYNEAAKWALDLCSWDGGGIYHLNELEIAKGNTCSLGQILPIDNHWLVSYNCPRSNINNDREAASHDVGISEVWDTPQLRSSPTVWATNRPSLKGGVVMTPWAKTSDYLVGWMETSNNQWLRNDVRFFMGRMNKAGRMLEGPWEASSLFWQGKGEMLTLGNGDIVWAFHKDTQLWFSRARVPGVHSQDTSTKSSAPLPDVSVVSKASENPPVPSSAPWPWPDPKSSTKPDPDPVVRSSKGKPTDSDDIILPGPACAAVPGALCVLAGVAMAWN